MSQRIFDYSEYLIIYIKSLVPKYIYFDQLVDNLTTDCSIQLLVSEEGLGGEIV